MHLVDSHCHIHSKDFPINKDIVFSDAIESHVQEIVCIGTDLNDSKRAIDFAEKNSSQDLKIYASIGIHPHEARFFNSQLLAETEILARSSQKVISIGEIGLDYHYNFSSVKQQQDTLESQIDLALKLDLPVVFHVRESYDDFWSIIDNFSNSPTKIRGVVHSFSDNNNNLNQALNRDFYIGINGISTFVKKPEEISMFDSVPLSKIILETDAPYLSPQGKRGKINQPAYIKIIAENMATRRNLSILNIAKITTNNFHELFIKHI